MTKSTIGSNATTPYHAAWNVLEKHGYSGGAHRLAKAILSLYNEEVAYSIREALDGADTEHAIIIVQMVAYYARNGEDKALREIGRKVYERYTGIWDAGAAGYAARCQVLENAR